MQTILLKTCGWVILQNVFINSFAMKIKIIQYFIMNRLALCIKVDSYMADMFYAWLFTHDKSVSIAIKKKNIFFPLIKILLKFSWGDCNSNKNRA